MWAEESHQPQERGWVCSFSQNGKLTCYLEFTYEKWVMLTRRPFGHHINSFKWEPNIPSGVTRIRTHDSLIWYSMQLCWYISSKDQCSANWAIFTIYKYKPLLVRGEKYIMPLKLKQKDQLIYSPAIHVSQWNYPNMSCFCVIKVYDKQEALVWALCSRFPAWPKG